MQGASGINSFIYYILSRMSLSMQRDDSSWLEFMINFIKESKNYQLIS